MSLAPDNLAYLDPRETPDGMVDFTPVLRDPTRPPDNAPTIHELDRAAKVILWHLAEGFDAETDHRVTFAHTVTDLNRWVDPRGFQYIVADYEALPMDGHHCPEDAAALFLVALDEFLRRNGYDNRKA